MNEWWGFLIGAAFGVGLDEAWQVGRRRFVAWRTAVQQRTLARRDDEVRHGAQVEQILQTDNVADLLYVPTRLGSTTSRLSRLPLLDVTSPSWVGPLDPSEDRPLVLVDPKPQALPYNASTIAQLSRSGVRLWDGPLCYLDPSTSADEMSVRIGNYFAFVDFRDRLMRQTDRVKRGSTILADQFLSLESAATGKHGPVALSGAVTCVFDTPGGYQVLTHQRAADVVSGRGLMGVVPLFGLEPHVQASQRSSLGLLPYNIAKEILEEVYGEDVNHAGDRPASLHPDAVFESPHGKAIIEWVRTGELTFHVSGAALDLTNACLAISIVAHFSGALYESVKVSARGSWETHRLDLVGLFDRELDQAYAEARLLPSSAYAIDAARRYLDGPPT